MEVPCVDILVASAMGTRECVLTRGSGAVTTWHSSPGNGRMAWLPSPTGDLFRPMRPSRTGLSLHTGSSTSSQLLVHSTLARRQMPTAFLTRQLVSSYIHVFVFKYLAFWWTLSWGLASYSNETSSFRTCLAAGSWLCNLLTAARLQVLMWTFCFNTDWKILSRRWY